MTQNCLSAATLYVVATPIGNVADMSSRAVGVLREVDCVAAEDTRVTRHLLDVHGLQTRLIALHEHNEERAAQSVIQMLSQGKRVALVSDAGTPGISDPGSRVVRLVREAGFVVSPVPGANAAAAAISISGFACPHFLFYGFLPARQSARRQALEGLAPLLYSVVFYEAPHRIIDCVSDLVAVMGAERRILIARELTKLFEQTWCGPLSQALAWFAEDAHRSKGEFVLVVEAAPEPQGPDPISPEAEKTLGILLEARPLKQAVALTVSITGTHRNVLYERALSLKQVI